MTRLRQRFWLAVMSAIAWLPDGFGSRPYLWALGKASDATDWGQGAKCGEEAPW